MKSNFTKAIGAGVFALSLTMLPLTLPAQAQVNDGTTTTTPGGTTSRTVTTSEDRGFDWGWLGLLGLAGLGGLAGKKRSENTTAYRDPNTAGTSTYRE